MVGGRLGLLAITIWGSARAGDAMLSRGTAWVPASQAVFLTKFCFDYVPGGGDAGEWHIELLSATPAVGQMQLALFDDQSSSYPNEEALSGFECDGLKLKTSVRWPVQDINVSALPSGGSFTLPLDERLRPRWWFVSVIDCSGVGRSLDYSIHMTNPLQGWQQEFSMDRCGVLWELAYSIFYAALATAQARALTVQSSSVESKHPLRLLLCTAIAAAASGMWMLTIDSLYFARSGLSLVFLHLWGKFLRAFSKFALALIVILLSKGLCISRPLRRSDLLSTGGLLFAFFVTCFVLEVWGEYAESRKYTTGSVYCSRFGAFLVVADLCLLGLYCVYLRGSYRLEVDDSKQKFYRVWAPIYSLAFLVLPLATFLSLVLQPWNRARIVFLVTNSLHVALLALLVAGLWPERTQEFFCIDEDMKASTLGATDDLLAEVEDIVYHTSL